MAKNKFFKLASVLVMLCLITTCAISTTFAKYATADSVSDTARVAKWGVRLSISGDNMLNNSYTNSDNAVTVLSTSTSQNVVAPNIVAPGTSGSTVFSIVGTPEVTTQINIDFTFTEDIYLKAGTYRDDTTGDNACTIAKDYYPVVFTLKQTHDANGKMTTPVTLASGNLAAIRSWLNTNYATAVYRPNTNLAATFELSWVWAFSSTGNANDAADTTLGNLIVDRANSTSIVQKVTTSGESTPVEGMTNTSDYNLDLTYSITITATQVD